MLSACANEVTVLIYGANVWRSAEVYLGGLRGKEIKVLPDMEGISASFNLVDFYKIRNSVSNPLGYEEVILRVNTRNGRDLQPIRIVGSRQPGDGKDKPADCVSPYSVSSPIVRHQQTSAPTIFAMAPSSIERCTGTSQIMLTGRNLLTKQPLASDLLEPQVFLNGREGKVTIVNPTVDGGKRQVISITFGQDATDLQRDSHDLILLNPGGFTTARLSAIPCGGAEQGETGRRRSRPSRPLRRHRQEHRRKRNKEPRRNESVETSVVAPGDPPGSAVDGRVGRAVRRRAGEQSRADAARQAHPARGHAARHPGDVRQVPQRHAHQPDRAAGPQPGDFNSYEALGDWRRLEASKDFFEYGPDSARAAILAAGEDFFVNKWKRCQLDELMKQPLPVLRGWLDKVDPEQVTVRLMASVDPGQPRPTSKSSTRPASSPRTRPGYRRRGD